MDLIEHLGYDPNRLLPAPRFIFAGPGRVVFKAIEPPSIRDAFDAAFYGEAYFEQMATLRQLVREWQTKVYQEFLAANAGLLLIDFESSGGVLSGFHEMPTPEPTIPTEPRKQNGRSTAYLALDPTKNTRRGRTGRKFRTADNRSSRK